VCAHCKRELAGLRMINGASCCGSAKCLGAAHALGIPSVWVDRLAEEPGRYEPDRRIPDLTPLPDVLDDQSKIVLVRRLAREGFLWPVKT